ncbi:hypothetical protein MJO28_016945 [Puccinia striiformis f. sp. tritici]|uniref:Uncharacterized protein n=1 Tax=Puccinia striiformis TaxID=27350 RepID=A0A2S4V645_9BASI|nr:hypothetical protein MJO28_016945 [Puccinia striiformis f. sp. tritici]POW05003.1 hypothetical protein PSTT_09999 [Puccinia striiformis]
METFKSSQTIPNHEHLFGIKDSNPYRRGSYIANSFHVVCSVDVRNIYLSFNLTPPPTDNPPLIEKPSKKKRAPSPNLVHPKQSSTDQIGGTGHMSTGLTKAYHHAPSRHLPGAAQTQPSPKNRPNNSPKSKHHHPVTQRPSGAPARPSLTKYLNSPRQEPYTSTPSSSKNINSDQDPDISIKTAAPLESNGQLFIHT